MLSMAARDGAYFKWVQAIEVRPGNIGVVHHVIVALRGVDDEIGVDGETGDGDGS